MYAVTSIALTLGGILLLCVSLVWVRRIAWEMPAGPLRRHWFAMAVLIGGFIFGYGIYAALWGPGSAAMVDLMVPAVFLFGGGFVFLSTRLWRRTAADIRRLAALESENVTDYLMQIYNRRYLDRRLEEEFARARRYELPLSVLMIDIDHFKRINDIYGHAVGDFVLQAFGRVVRQMIRGTDIAARYGGEEVVVIAVNTPLGGAVILAEHMREGLAAHDVPASVGRGMAQPIGITVSVGVAAIGTDTPDAAALVEAADRALYAAKASGRNRVRGLDTAAPSQSSPAGAAHDSSDAG